MKEIKTSQFIKKCQYNLPGDPNYPPGVGPRDIGGNDNGNENIIIETISLLRNWDEYKKNDNEILLRNNLDPNDYQQITYTGKEIIEVNCKIKVFQNEDIKEIEELNILNIKNSRNEDISDFELNDKERKELDNIITTHII